MSNTFHMAEDAVKRVFSEYKKLALMNKKTAYSSCRCYSCAQTYSPDFELFLRSFRGNTSTPDGEDYLGWYITLTSVCPKCSKVNKHYRWVYDHPVLMRMAELVERGLEDSRKLLTELYRFSPFFK